MPAFSTGNLDVSTFVSFLSWLASFFLPGVDQAKYRHNLDDCMTAGCTGEYIWAEATADMPYWWTPECPLEALCADGQHRPLQYQSCLGLYMCIGLQQSVPY
jgi:hypothetical protein